MAAMTQMPGRRQWLRAAAAGTGLAWLSGAGAQPRRVIDGALRVGLVYGTAAAPYGWVRQHELARQYVQRRLGDRVQAAAVENIPEGRPAEQAIRDLANQGNRLIFGTAFGFQDSMIRTAREFPEFAFENIGGYKRSDNVSTCSVRQHEGRYLTGIIAGRMTRSNAIGYVAAEPFSDVIRGINAFTLGARSVNPSAQVHVRWANAWNDEQRDRAHALELIEAGSDVLTHHTDSAAVLKTAEEKGVAVIGHASDGSTFARTRHLASLVIHWERYYLDRAQAVLKGEWRSQDHQGGLADGMLRLEAVSRRVPADVQKQVAAARNQLIRGELNIFSGPLVSNKGEVRVEKGARLEPQRLEQMDWFVEGVQGRI